MFREKVFLSIMSKKKLIIEYSLKSYEKRFLNFICLLTQGTKITYKNEETIIDPGMVVGGNHFFDCGIEKGIGYFLEYSLLFCLFGQKKTEVSLTGITNNNEDVSVDAIKNVYSKILDFFIPNKNINIKINRRGFSPHGGGDVFFTCSPILKIDTVNLTKEGEISKIRGISLANRIPPQTTNRLVASVKEILNCYISDVFIHTDVSKGKEAGKSPGYGLCITAETTTGGLFFFDGTGLEMEFPENLSICLTKKLLSDIYNGGFVGKKLQIFVCFLMAMSSSEKPCCVTIGKLSKKTKLVIQEIEKSFCIYLEFNQKQRQLICVGYNIQNYGLLID